MKNPTTELFRGRIVADYGERYELVSDDFSGPALLSGSLLHESAQELKRPVVGDYVDFRIPEGADFALIEKVCERENLIYRRAPGPGSGVGLQPLAANVERAFLVQGMDGDYNLRRMERYISMAGEFAVEAVLVFNKCDLLDEATLVRRREEIAQRFPGRKRLFVSAKSGEGAQELLLCVGPGDTVVLLGSSGAGKSTIVNLLLGEERQKTFEVREDDSRGRHITSTRNIFPLPGGGFLMDTPGMRELGMVDFEEGTALAFPEIERLAKLCKFSDCSHESEPGCAVLEAVERGELDRDQLRNYRTLQREMEYLEAKQSGMRDKKRTEGLKRISRLIREGQKDKGRDGM